MRNCIADQTQTREKQGLWIGKSKRKENQEFNLCKMYKMRGPENTNR